MVGLVFALFGVMGKMAAAMTLCPPPVFAGFNMFNFGIITSVGVANMAHVDMRSSRNLVIVALSLMIGLSVPSYVKDNPEDLDTGLV